MFHNLEQICSNFNILNIFNGNFDRSNSLLLNQKNELKEKIILNLTNIKHNNGRV